MKQFLLSLFLLSTYLLQAQDTISIKEIGFPFIRNYDGLEYNNADQNWAAIEDSLGILYFGNQGGLLVFNGTTWNSYELENKEGVKSLAKDRIGTIYYGTNGDFGFLSADSIGQLKINSLKDLFPEEGKEIGTISNIVATIDYIFFHSRNSLYVYHTKEKSIQELRGSKLRWPAKVADSFYILEGNDLLRFQNDSLISTPFTGNEKANIKFIMEMNGKLLISTEAEMVLYDGIQFSNNAIQPYQLPENIRCINQIEGYTLIGTRDQGLIIFDQLGKQVLKLDKSSGILNSSINNIYLDRFKNLWILHDVGISKVEWNSAYSILDERNQLHGGALITEVYGNRLFVGTRNGLFSTNWDEEKMNEFQKINKGVNSFWYLLHDGNSLISGNDNGVIMFNQEESETIYKNEEVSYSMAFTKNKNYILVGTKFDFFVLKRDQENWILHKKISNFHQLSDFLINIDQNSFWMSNSGSGLFKLTLNEKKDSLSYKAYGPESGLPSVYNNRIFQHKNGVKFTTQNGIYNYLPESDSFEKDSILSDLMDNQFVYRFEEGSNGQIWFVHGGTTTKIGVLCPSQDGYSKEELPDKKLAQFDKENINPIDDQNVLIANKYGLLHINPSKSLINRTSYQSFITSVINTSNDSLIAATYFNRLKRYIFPSSIHSLQFNFSAASYDDHEKNQFQWRLRGFDSNWSSFKSEHRKDFTNLSHGDYIFEVRAKNVYNVSSKVGQFRFTILSPWYFTWWAYVIYGSLFMLILITTARIHSRRLKAENERLEGVVEERTKEIRSQKETIEKSLAERESLLKEIHHRVKNNLQIIASLLYLQSGKFENEDFKKVLEEGQGRVRSMALIHQKLYENEDLKSIPFGEYLNELVSEIRASFGMHNIQLNINAEDIHFDVDTAVPLGLIVNEMATNAFKYAFLNKEKGSISIFLTEEDGEYILNIKDDGKGIPEEVDIRKTKSLGLRLVRMLSQQLEGDFEFKSDNGTSFKLKFVA